MTSSMSRDVRGLPHGAQSVHACRMQTTLHTTSHSTRPRFTQQLQLELGTRCDRGCAGLREGLRTYRAGCVDHPVSFTTRAHPRPHSAARDNHGLEETRGRSVQCRKHGAARDGT